MTTQQQIIAICVLVFIGVPVGTFTIIKCINKLSRPPVNTLVRSGDLELVDYIEPTRPQQIFNYPDLLESHDRIPYHTSYIERISDYGRVPSYWSGSPPSYQTVDRSYINSSLENSINLDFIFWIILFCVFLLVIRKLIISNKLDINKINNLIIINLLVLFLGTVYIQFGLLVLFQIILWMIVFITSDVLIGLNPWNIKFHITRILSICVIIYILCFNSFDISIQTSLLLPFSISKITFSKDIIAPYSVKLFSEKEESFYFWDDKEIKDFLKSLDNYNYIVNMYFYLSDEDWDAPKMLLSKPFLINRYSSHTTIRKFINERLDLMVEKYCLEDIVIQPDVIGPIIKFHYRELYIM